MPLALLALGLAPWLTGPASRVWQVFGISASSWAVIRLFAAIPGLLGAGLIAGELFGTDAPSPRAVASPTSEEDHIITGSPRFVATFVTIVVSLLLSAWAGRATETGPDVMGTALVPALSYAALLVSALFLATHIERSWITASRRERAAGLFACLSALVAIPCGIALFSAFAQTRA